MAGRQVSPAKVSAPFADFPDDPIKELLVGVVPANGCVKPAMAKTRQSISKTRKLCYKILFDGLTRGRGSVLQGEAWDDVRHSRHSVTSDKIFLFGFSVTH
jgi:hypothetical protein